MSEVSSISEKVSGLGPVATAFGAATPDNYNCAMPFELKIALRYLLAPKAGLVKFTAAVAVVGIAAGVAALIVADSLTRGFADEMRDKILGNTAHISISLNGGGPISQSDIVSEEVSEIANVTEAIPGGYEHAVVSSDTATSYALLRVDSGDSVLVGKLLAERLGITAGEKIEILTLGADRPTRLTVNGVFESGIHEYDTTWIRLPRNSFAAVVGEQIFTPRVIELRLRDIFRSEETARRLRDVLGDDFKVTEWQETNRNLFAALALEQKAAGLIVGLIIFVAVLNITTTLSLLTHERRFDIGVFRACGARTRSIASIFLIEGALIGVVGTSFGIVAGLAACWIGNRFNLVSLPADVYSLNRIPFHPAAETVAVIAVGAIVLATSAALYPAFRAGRYRAIENLRAH